MQLEDVCHEVVGLTPAYVQKGDGCKILCQTGDGQLSEITKVRTVEMIKRQLARCYALDLSAQSLALRQDYHRAPPLPFYLHDGRVFVPLKMRLPKVPGDPCYGYLEVGIISRAVPDSHGHCRLILQDGSRPLKKT